MLQQWNLYSLPTKVKLFIGFYMIATKIGRVYDTSIPPEVTALLKIFEVVVSFGFEFLSATPLECANLGYKGRLLFW